MIGQMLGPYRIIEQIGRGGMATVYKAYHASMDRNVAIKIIPQHFASNPDFTARFEREAKVVAKLQHPHILPVFDYGQEGEISYIVMPYMPSGDLKKYIKTKAGKQSFEEIVRIFSQLSAALDYAHQRGILHRDIKPDNVLFDESLNPLLGDFGLTKMVESGSNLTGSSVIGTPSYMSPEQGQGFAIDHRSDIYSMGIVLYEMVTGRVPYSADTPIAVIFMHVKDPLPLPQNFRPDLPDEAQNVILKALSKDPNDRYQTCQECAQAFASALLQQDTQKITSSLIDNEPPTVVGLSNTTEIPTLDNKISPIDTHEPSTQPQLKPARSNRKFIIPIAIALVAIIGSGALFLSSVLAPATAQPTATAVAQSVEVDIDEPSPIGVVDNTPTFTPTPIPTSSLTTPSIQVLRSGVPVRNAPSFDATTMMRLNSGDQLEVLGISEDGNWYLIDLVDTQAWVANSDSITTSGDLMAISIALPTTTATVTSTSTNTLIPTYSPEPTATASNTATTRPSPTYTNTPKPTNIPIAQVSVITVGDETSAKLIAERTEQTTDSQLWQMIINPSGTRLMSTSWNGSATIYDMLSGEALGQIHHQQGRILAAAFIPKTPLFITAGDDGEIRFWNSDSFELERTLPVGNEINYIELSPHWLAAEKSPYFTDVNRHVLAVASDTLTILYDDNFKHRFELPSQSPVMSIAFTSDSMRLAAGLENGDIDIWDLESQTKLMTLTDHFAGVSSLAFSPDNRFIVGVGDYESEIYVWDAESGDLLRYITGHENGTLDIQFSANGKYLVTGSDDSTARIWDFETGDNLLVISNHQQSVYSIALSADNRFLATGDGIGTVRFFELSGFEPDVDRLIKPEGRLLSRCEILKQRICVNGQRIPNVSIRDGYLGVSWSPDGEKIFYADGDNLQTVYRINADGSNKTRIDSYIAQKLHINPIASPNGQALVSIVDCQVVAHDVNNEQPVILHDDEGCYEDIQWSADSQFLVASWVPRLPFDRNKREVRILQFGEFGAETIFVDKSFGYGDCDNPKVAFDADTTSVAFYQDGCSPTTLGLWTGEIHAIETFPDWWRSEFYPQWGSEHEVYQDVMSELDVDRFIEPEGRLLSRCEILKQRICINGQRIPDVTIQDNYLGASWSPNGDRIFYADGDNLQTVYRINADGSNKTKIDSYIAQKLHINPVSSPNGQALVSIVDCQVVARDMNNEQMVILHDDEGCYEDIQWSANSQFLVASWVPRLPFDRSKREVRILQFGEFGAETVFVDRSFGYGDCDNPKVAFEADTTSVAFYQDGCSPTIYELRTREIHAIETFPDWWRSEFYPQWGIEHEEYQDNTSAMLPRFGDLSEETLQDLLREPEDIRILEHCEFAGRSLCVIERGLTSIISHDAIPNIWSMTWSPDGEMIAVSVFNNEPPNEQYYILNKHGDILDEIHVAGENVGDLAWSPSGEWIAFHASCQLAIIHPDGTDMRHLVNVDDDACLWDAQWSPDSRHIVGSFVISEPDTDGVLGRIIRLIEIETQTIKDIFFTEQHIEPCIDSVFSPDGQYISFYDETCQPMIVTIDEPYDPRPISTFPYWWRDEVYPQWGYN